MERAPGKPLSPDEAKAQFRAACARVPIALPVVAGALAVGLVAGISPAVRRAALTGVTMLIRGREKLAAKSGT